MSTPHLPLEWALRVRRAASVGLSISALALSLLGSVPLGMLMIDGLAPGVDHPEIPDEVREFAFGCVSTAIVAGAFALLLAAGTMHSGGARAALPLRLAIVALLSVGVSIVIVLLPVFLFVASLLLTLVIFW